MNLCSGLKDFCVFINNGVVCEVIGEDFVCNVCILIFCIVGVIMNMFNVSEML